MAKAQQWAGRCLAGVSEDLCIPAGSGLSAVELSTMNSSLDRVKCLSCCIYISLIAASNEGGHVEVPSTGPGNSFSICLNLCVCVHVHVSSFEDDIKNSKDLADSCILNWDWGQKSDLPS